MYNQINKQIMKRKFTLLLLCALASSLVNAAEVVVSANITSNTLWTADNSYVLDGFIFVEDGATLTIEPGTVVYAQEGSEANASALIIKRGGKINAVGTATDPIVFTSIKAKTETLDELDRGLWGGLIILGKGPHNNTGNDNAIEGVPEDEQAYYGGDDPLDNSGRLRFVSIRHGGSQLKPDEEINGLTLGAVGSGTSISFVEIYANDDDGIEWFGGNVDTKNMLVAYCSDDGFDMDEGVSGKGQFWVAITDEDSDNFGEHDGGPSSNRYGMPYARPIMSNVTYIGPGTAAAKRTLTLREYWGGQYHNSIFAEQGKGLRVDYVQEFTGGNKGGSYTLWHDGILKIENNIFQHVADGTAANIFTVYSDQKDGANDKYPVPADSATAFANYFATAGNTVNNSLGVSITNPVPANAADVAGPVFTGMDAFFKKVDYKGAFNPEITTGNWAGGWTKTYSSVAFANSEAGEVIVTNDITSDVTWTNDNDYVLDGFIFVEDGATLTIEEGTTIYAEEGSGANASALIVKRGGKIIAVGTASEPIVLTSILAQTDDLTEADRGLWGGLILLGKGPSNNTGNDNAIEGVPEEEQAYYGGDISNDNSGTLKFVSIRHGGSELRPDEEINGLTLGAVGSGTSISFVEIYANDDDGVEWFGGNVDTKNMLVAYCSDDAFDMDEGVSGKGQFWVAITDEDSDNFGEHDGGPSSNRYGMPYARPIMSNVTYIGPGTAAAKRTLTLREYWGGQYHNSIFAEQGKGLRVDYVQEFTGGNKGGSYTLWHDGILKIENNIFQHVADGTAANIFTVYSDQKDGANDKYPVPADSATAFANYFATAGNTVNNSLGVSIADPVPASADVADPVYTGLDAFFVKASYKGAFNPYVDGLWAGGWTKTYASEIFNDDIKTGFRSFKSKATQVNVYPNPVSTSNVTVSFENVNSIPHSFELYSIDGKMVKSIQNIYSASFTFDRDGLSNGIYLYKLRNDNAIISSGKLMVR
jgi:hypothetical protein